MATTSLAPAEGVNQSASPDWFVPDTFAPRFPASWAVPVAAGTLWDASHAAAPRSSVGPAPEGPSWYVSVGPGRIRIGSVDLARGQRAAERAVSRRSHRVHEGSEWLLAEPVRAAGQALVSAGLIAAADAPELCSDPLGSFPSRSRITEWSGKSRRAMLDRLSTLDYAPLIGQGTPAMVTLTLPGEWERHAPTGRAFKALVRSFAERFRRAWGTRLRGIWKLEFQRRGAPHLHVLMVPPTGEVDGQRWRDWFASTWAGVVLAATAKREGVPASRFALERAAMIAVHAHRKASQDYAEGLRASDPKRVAVYFLKHNLLRDKEYQHVVPAAWQGEGDGPGRFWGYWQLERADELVPVTDDQAVTLARTLRRWHKSKAGTHRVSVWRCNTTTGTVRRRTVRRPLAAMPVTRGFLLVNDGPEVALMLAARLRA